MFMDYEDRLEGGTSYVGDFQTPHLDMRHLDASIAGKTKLWDWLSVTYVPSGDWDLSCDYFIDGKYIDTVTFPMVQYQDSQLNVMVLDTSRLAQSNTETTPLRPLTGHGRTISFRFYQAGSNESFQITNYTIGFRVAAEQAQRT